MNIPYRFSSGIIPYVFEIHQYIYENNCELISFNVFFQWDLSFVKYSLFSLFSPDTVALCPRTSKTSLQPSFDRTRSIECISESGWTWSRRERSSGTWDKCRRSRHLLHVGRPLKRVCRRQYRATGYFPGRKKGTRIPFVIGIAKRQEYVECADADEGSIGPTVTAACRSRRRSQTIAWRATRASYAYRLPFVKSVCMPSPPSRSRRTVIVSLSSDRCQKRRAWRV